MAEQTPVKRGRGQPTKLNAEVQKKICDLVQAGNYMETAASAAGIDRQTFRLWLKRGARSKSGLYYDFHRAVLDAEAKAESSSVARVRDAAREQWQAAAWWLERKYPDRWGRNELRRLELSGPEGKPVQIIRVAGQDIEF